MSPAVTLPYLHFCRIHVHYIKSLCFCKYSVTIYFIFVTTNSNLFFNTGNYSTVLYVLTPLFSTFSALFSLAFSSRIMYIFNIIILIKTLKGVNKIWIQVFLYRRLPYFCWCFCPPSFHLLKHQ